MALKSKLESIISDTEKTAKEFLDKSKDYAVKVIDQNGDGKLDITDVSLIADNMETSVKTNTQSMLNQMHEKARELELKTLCPIMLSDLVATDFLMPKLIRIVERDKRRAESDVCQGSIGYISTPRGVRIVNIFTDSADCFNLSFFPDCSSGFYYIDPSDRNRYIALDDYFNYLKTARIAELQKIAQDLGAKHFRIIYKDENLFTATKGSEIKGKGKGKDHGSDANIKVKSTNTDSTREIIAAEMDFPGHEPVNPQLRYMINDPSILSLISMRLDKSSPLKHQKYDLSLSASSGLKENDAITIDAILNDLKLAGSLSLSREAKRETKKSFEYEIDF